MVKCMCPVHVGMPKRKSKVLKLLSTYPDRKKTESDFAL